MKSVRLSKLLRNQTMTSIHDHVPAIAISNGKEEAVELTDGQTKALEMIERFLESEESYASITGSAGTGKLQPMHEPILTPQGWLTMKDIHQGMQVFSEEGIPVNVLKTFYGENLNIYRVTFSDGSTSDCCEDHLWRVHTGKMKQRGNHTVLSLKAMMASGLKKPERSGYRYAVQLTAPVCFEGSANLRLDPYVMGYILGNGCSRANLKRIQVTTSARDFEEVVSRFPPLDTKPYKTSKVCRFKTLVSDALTYDSYGLKNLKSGAKFIPLEYLNHGDPLKRKQLLAGLMDSDGSVSKTGNKVSFSSTSLQLAKDVQALVRSLGGRAVLSTLVRAHHFKTTEHNISIRLPFNCFSLERKAKRYRPKWLVSDKHIIKSEFLGVMDGKCLLVDSPTHLYLCKDFTVTHNTFMMSKASELLSFQEFAATAPTNKAVDVLKKFLPFGTKSLTLHKFLGLGVKYVKGVPKSYKRDDFDPWQHDDVRLVVCDEASMLDDGLMQHIADDAKENGRKYLFVGDPCQLPPVEGKLKYSGSFDVAPEAYRVHLTEIVRQAADNPIIKVATAIRDAINEGVQPEIFGEINPITGQGVHLLNRLEFNAKLKEVVANPRIHEDVDYCRVVAWRNRTCRTVNKHIRKLLGEDVSRPFSEGDLVVVNSAYEVGGKIIAGTGDEVTVLSLMQNTHPLYGYKGWTVGLHNPRKNETLPVGLVCIDDDYVDQLADKLEELRENALRDRSKWSAFYALKGFYIDIRPPYCLTSHKAQGSTFENVFVHYKDIYENRRKITADKCYYVAVTRASQNVYILY